MLRWSELLARLTELYMIPDVMPDMGPPILLADSLYRDVSSKMVAMIMILREDSIYVRDSNASFQLTVGVAILKLSVLNDISRRLVAKLLSLLGGFAYCH